jgi:type II secretory pathway component PulF
MIPAFRRLRQLATPFAFGLPARAETWQLVADLVASRMDTGRALSIVATMYRQRGKYLLAWGVDDLRASLATGEFPKASARLAGNAEALLFSRYATADAQRMFEGAARIARSQQKIRAAIINAVATPALLVGLLTVLFYIMGSNFFPTLAQVTQPSLWSPQARAIAYVADIVVNHHWRVLAVAGGLVLILRVSLPLNFPGRRLLDRLPPWSLYKLSTGSAFLFSVVETGRMGGDLKSATLMGMAQLAPPYVRVRINRIAIEAQRANLGEAAIAAGDGFPAQDVNTVLAAMAAQDGWLDRFARYLDRWLETIEQNVKRMTAVLNVVLLAMVTGTIAASLSAIFSVLQAVH